MAPTGAGILSLFQAPFRLLSQGGKSQVKKGWAFFCLLLVLTTTAAAQQQTQTLADSLRSLGYEEVAVEQRGSTLFVDFENRLFRDHARSLYQVAQLAFRQADTARFLRLTLKERGLPVVTLGIQKSSELSASLRAGPDQGTRLSNFLRWDLPAPGRTLAGEEPGSLRRIDLVLQPQLRLLLGDMTDPVKYQLNLAPALVVAPWRGAEIVAQLIVPLHNELRRSESRVRPGLVVVNQLWRLPWNTFLCVSGGYFMPYRYGLDLRAATYLLRGRLALLGSLGRTGYAFAEGHVLYYSDLDRTTYLASAWYRLRYADLSFGLTAGRFLYGDLGWRWDILRRFGEFRLGFFALLTELGRNGGFTLAVPLPQKKYSRPQGFRFRLARSFDWEYRYRGLRNPGKTYRTGFGDPLRDLDPAHLANQFDLFQLQDRQ